MVLDRLVGDAELLRDFAVGLLPQSTHQEDAPRSRRHCQQRRPKDTPDVDFFYAPYLVGRNRRIAFFIEWIEDGASPLLPACPVDQQVARDPEQIGLGMIDPVQRAATQEQRERFLRQIGGVVASSLSPEIAEHPCMLSSIESLEGNGGRTGRDRGGTGLAFACVGVAAADMRGHHHRASTAARQSVKARIM